MPKTLTIACCGTNFDENSDDIVAQFAKNIKGERYKDWLIFAGPGSTAISSQSYNPLEKPTFSTLSTLSEVATLPYNKLVYKVKGLTTGEGMELNTNYLLAFLDNLYSFDRPSVINMFGWSRGACTCVMMANAVSDYYEKKNASVTINIFAIDPVPGPGNFVKEVLELPKCVKHCTVIQMENESRPAMIGAKMRAANDKTTVLTELRFPGNHSSGVTSGKSAETPVYKVVTFQLYEFLLYRGTELECSIKETHESICAAYAKMILKQDKFLELGAVNRLLGDEKDYYPLGHYLLRKSYFINDDHESMFRSAYMDVYKRVFSFGTKLDQTALKDLDSPPIQSKESTLQRRRTKADEVWESMPSDVQDSLLRCEDIKQLGSKLKSATKPSTSTSLSLMSNTTFTKPFHEKSE